MSIMDEAIFTIDAGNSFTKFEFFKGENSLRMWKIKTNRVLTASKFAEKIAYGFRSKEIQTDIVDTVVLSSVVPSITKTMEDGIKKYFGDDISLINVGVNTNTEIDISSYGSKLGGDRIADMVAASKIYGVPNITVNFGTATVINVVNEKKQFIGGNIIPGGSLSLEALLQRASHLPKIKIKKTKLLIGDNTVGSMQTGIFWGIISQAEGLIHRIKRELFKDKNVIIIATGELSEVLQQGGSEYIDYYDSGLTRKGLRIIGISVKK